MITNFVSRAEQVRGNNNTAYSKCTQQSSAHTFLSLARGDRCGYERVLGSDLILPVLGTVAGRFLRESGPFSAGDVLNQGRRDSRTAALQNSAPDSMPGSKGCQEKSLSRSRKVV